MYGKTKLFETMNVSQITAGVTKLDAQDKMATGNTVLQKYRTIL